MKKKIFTLLCSLPFTGLFAQSTPTLAADITSGSSGTEIGSLTSFGSNLYFWAKTAVRPQFWKYDGATAVQAMLFTNSNALRDNWYPFAVANGKLYVPTDSGLTYLNGATLTLLPAGSAANAPFANIGTKMYFFWGTFIYSFVASNTVVQEYDATNIMLNAFQNVINTYGLVAYNNKLYFAGANTSDNKLCVYDPGTNTGTAIDVPGAGPASQAFPQNFIVGDDNKLYFSARTDADGREIWQYDGTTLTQISSLNGVNSTIESMFEDMPFYYNIAQMNGYVYFVASDGTSGKELMRVNTTTKVANLVKDINPGASNSMTGAQRLYRYGNNIFFAADNGTQGYELWKSNGTAAGTVMLGDTNPGISGSNPDMFAGHAGKLYFTATNGASGMELFKVDTGTSIPSGVLPTSAAINSFNVYPNPAGNETNIRVELNAATSLSVKLFDRSGRQVYAGATLPYAVGTSIIILPMDKLANGIYSCLLADEAGKVLGVQTVTKQ